jgi:hypothetical protein
MFGNDAWKRSFVFMKMNGLSDEVSFDTISLASANLGAPALVLDYLLVDCQLMNIDSYNGAPVMTGPAAIGNSEDDYWNPYTSTASDFTATGLKHADQTDASGVSLRVQNATGVWDIGSTASPMINHYNYNAGSTIVLTANNLPAGKYDFYGAINVSGYDIWVNGVLVVVNCPAGPWTASGVLLEEVGTVTVHIEAVPTGTSGGSQSRQVPTGESASEFSDGMTENADPAMSVNTAPGAAPTAREETKITGPYIRISEYSESPRHTSDRYNGIPPLYVNTATRTMTWQDMLTASGTSGTRTIDCAFANGGMYSHSVTTWPGNGGLGSTTTEFYYPYFKETTLNVSRPYVQWEQCEVNVKTTGDNGAIYEYRRTAKTKLELRTGGKAPAKRKNLIVLNAQADEILTATYDPFDVPAVPDKNYIAPQTLTLGKLGNPGRDGFLYTLQSDGVSVDVTPKASKAFYITSIGVTKHQLVITANTVVLNPDRLVPNATYCVGQKIDFTSVFVPAVRGVASIKPIWSFEDGYINYYYQNQAGCTIYKAGTSWLTKLNTRAWYYKEGDRTIRVGLNVQFANGQKLSLVTASGCMRVYRPIGSLVHQNAHGIPIYNIVEQGNGCGIKVGTLTGNNIVEFDGRVGTKYSGRIYFTQVIQSMEYKDVFGINKTIVNALDNEEHFRIDSSVGVNENPSGYLNVNAFTDSPEVYSFSPVYHRATFKAYLRFSPNIGIASDNIYVTLGSVQWSIDGEAVSNPWRLTKTNIIVPSNLNVNDYAFPLWDNVWSNKD